jgi:RNA polymerase sigma factor (sigma-70 family)
MKHESVDTQDDQSLMVAVRQGEVAKLGILFERHHGHLFNFLLRLTGDRHLSEDLVQEVFVRLLKYRHTYRAESQFTTWMFQIARNARIDYFRRNPRDEVRLEDEVAEQVSLTPSPGEQAEQKEEMRILLHALSSLSEEKRAVLLLRGFQGMKFEEIAKVMRCPVNTAKGRAFKAIRELREALPKIRAEQTSWNATG